MGLENIISLLRVSFVPVIILLLWQEEIITSVAALLVLFLLLCTSIWQHYHFRKKKSVSGSFFRPLTDKFIIFILLLFYVWQGSFLVILFALFLFRDAVVLLIRWLAAQDGVIIHEEEYSAVIIYTYFAIIFSLLVNDLLIYLELYSGIKIAQWFLFLFTVLAVILTLFSIIHHGVVYLRGLRWRKQSGKEITPEKIVILANPKASGYHDGYRRHLLNIFARRRKAAVLYLPQQQEMYHKVEQKLKHIPHVVIAGGDGSFESALNYPPFQDKSLGFFPLGSGNAYYSYFYQGKRFEYLRSRFQFREAELDVLEIEHDHGKTQTTFVTVGYDAEVIHHRPMGKFGFFWYMIAALKVAFTLPTAYSLHCTVGTRKVWLRNAINFNLGKIPYYGFALRSLVGPVQPDDHLVYGLALVNTHSRWWNKPVRGLGLLMAALNLEKPPVISFKGKKIIIESKEPFPLQAGGEFLGYSKMLKVRVKRKQKVLVI